MIDAKGNKINRDDLLLSKTGILMDAVEHPKIDDDTAWQLQRWVVVPWVWGVDANTDTLRADRVRLFKMILEG